MLAVNPQIMQTNNLGARLASFPGPMLAVSQEKVLRGVGGFRQQEKMVLEATAGVWASQM